MRYSRVGGSGLRVSALGLGTWKDRTVAEQIIAVALEAGINLLMSQTYTAMATPKSLLERS